MSADSRDQEIVKALREGRSFNVIKIPFDDEATRQQLSTGSRVMRALANDDYAAQDITFISGLLSFLSRKGEVDVTAYNDSLEEKMGADFDIDRFRAACHDVASLVADTEIGDENILFMKMPEDDESATNRVSIALRAIAMLTDDDSAPEEIASKSALLSSLFAEGQIDINAHQVALEKLKGPNFSPQRFREACREVALFVLDTLCVNDGAKAALQDELTAKESYRDFYSLEFVAPEQLGGMGWFNRNVIMYTIELLKPLVESGSLNISEVEEKLNKYSNLQYTAFISAIAGVKHMIKEAETALQDRQDF